MDAFVALELGLNAKSGSLKIHLQEVSRQWLRDVFGFTGDASWNTVHAATWPL